MRFDRGIIVVYSIRMYIKVWFEERWEGISRKVCYFKVGMCLLFGVLLRKKILVRLLIVCSFSDS